MRPNDQTLPWDALEGADDETPWAELETFARALAEHPSAFKELAKLYDLCWQANEGPLYACLYIPTIFALAAPHLSQLQKSAIAAFLVKRLVQAGQEEDDLLQEVLCVACGSLGPACVPPVLDALAREKHTDGAWFHLWILAGLAAESDDGALRERARAAGRNELRRVERRRMHPIVATGAVWLLALLRDVESRPVIERLARAVDEEFRPEFEMALAVLDGKAPDPDDQEWNLPVREWFEPYWQAERDWFEGQEGDDDEEEGAREAETLADRFEQSPFVTALPETCRDEAAWIAFNVIYYARGHLGAGPDELDQGVLRELLLHLLPAKVPAGRETFERVAPVTQALLRWLASDGVLENGAELAGTVGTWGEEIVANAMDPYNWGITKSLAMGAMAHDVDVADPDAMDRYVADINRRAHERFVAEEDLDRDEPPPVLRREPEVGRNDPCPCGSGKKYKKCCGAK